MANHHLNRVARDLAVEQSLDAAIEINEVINHKRQDAPALLKLAIVDWDAVRRNRAFKTRTAKRFAIRKSFISCGSDSRQGPGVSARP